MPAGDNDVEMLGLDLGEHLRKQCFVMLEVAVHHRDIGRGAGEDAFNAGRAEAAPAKPLQAADIRLPRGDRAHCVGGAVGRLVVDENRFPGDAAKHRVEAFDNESETLSRSLRVGMTMVSSTATAGRAGVSASSGATTPGSFGQKLRQRSSASSATKVSAGKPASMRRR